MISIKMLGTAMVLCLGLVVSAGAVPEWKPAGKAWPEAWGSQRVVLEVPAGAVSARAHVEWRRRDAGPGKKAVVVRLAGMAEPVANVAVLDVTNEAGDLVFETKGAPLVEVYFLPAVITGGAFPKSHYVEPKETAGAEWKALAGIGSEGWKTLPAAKVVQWEARTALDVWDEMEVIATAEETAAWKAKQQGRPFAVRVEDRAHVVKMFDRLPARWISNPEPEALTGKPGEFVAFQIALVPHQGGLEQVTVAFSALAGPGGRVLEAGRVQSFNGGGLDWTGRPFSREVKVAPGRVQPLWCGVDFPVDAAAGDWTGEAVVSCTAGQVKVPLRFRLAGPAVTDHGDADPHQLTQLRWLNSTLALDDEVPAGYAPLVVKERTVSCLGREVALGEDGLPVQITSHFNGSVTQAGPQWSLPLLSAPMQLVIASVEGPLAARVTAPLSFTKTTPGVVEWTSAWEAAGVVVKLRGRMEFDGSLNFETAVSGSRAVADVRLEVPRTAESARYAIGLGQEAGAAPAAFDWKWDVAHKNQDSVWLGAVNGGLRLQLKSDNYRRPGVNIHYQRRTLADPAAWTNAGSGGVRYADRRLTAFSGARTLAADQPLRFDFALLVTPFHELRTGVQWTERYFHTSGVPKNDPAGYLDKAREAGANIVNIHQGNWLNPYINYPFLTARELGGFTSQAHERGMRVKFYYTVRELSNWTPLLHPIRSMDDEIFLHGKGGGHPWFDEHLGGDALQAWYEPAAQDISLLTQPMSRWHNLYIEGLRWMVENAGCDGIYLDDISYDRSVMLRARKVLDRYNPRGARIDLHSWNEFHEGGAWAQCANLFMDSLPFVDRMWFGEGHHYTGPPPEHFLVEISGVPFGLMGEMLEGGGNAWFGLVHGCTGRLGWQGDPRAVWKVWDDFGVKDSEFTGWWDDGSPVKSADPQVKATFWKKPGAVLLAVANFSDKPKPAALTVDLARLGLPATVKAYAPAMAIGQREGLYALDKLPALRPHGGAVYVLDTTPRNVPPPPASEFKAQLEQPVLLEEKFADPAWPGWKAELTAKASTGAGAMKSENGLALRNPIHTHAWLERPLPAGVTVVQARIYQDPADEAQQWGPGFALVWPDGRALKACRRFDRRFSLGIAGRSELAGGLTDDGPVDLTVLLTEKEIVITASGPAMGGEEDVLLRVPRSTFSGPPALLRVGKMPDTARPEDHGTPGPVGSSRIEWVKVRGADGARVNRE